MVDQWSNTGIGWQGGKYTAHKEKHKNVSVLWLRSENTNIKIEIVDGYRPGRKIFFLIPKHLFTVYNVVKLKKAHMGAHENCIAPNMTPFIVKCLKFCNNAKRFF